MQMIMLLLGLFVIGGMLYGITAGVQVIQRGLSWLANSRHSGDVPATRPAPVTLPTAEPDNAKERARQCEGAAFGGIAVPAQHW